MKLSAAEETFGRDAYPNWKILAALAGLAALPYLRALWLPLISDDHLQVLLSRQYGPVSGWPALLADPLYRTRATSLLLTHWTELLAGFSPFAFHLSGIALHVVNTWLVLLLGAWTAVGWRTAAFAAAFFAVYEGHQEAVIWYAALPELLVFTFGLAAFLCWVAWIESECTRTRCLAGALAAFALALFSKESAALVAPLLILPVAYRPARWRKALPAVALFAGVAAAYFGLIYAARSGVQHFQDGAFALDALAARTVAYSAARLLWFWGLLGLAALAIFRERRRVRLLAVAAAWICIAFLPYSFLTYMPFVPSRHTYFASAGLALIVAAGFLALAGRLRGLRWAPAAVAAVVALHNAGYVWTKKQGQYVERAAPIQAVIRAARSGDGPVYVRAFPYPFPAAVAAVMIETGRPADAVRPWSGKSNPPEGLYLDMEARAK